MVENPGDASRMGKSWSDGGRLDNLVFENGVAGDAL